MAPTRRPPGSKGERHPHRVAAGGGDDATEERRRDVVGVALERGGHVQELLAPRPAGSKSGPRSLRQCRTRPATRADAAEAEAPAHRDAASGPRPGPSRRAGGRPAHPDGPRRRLLGPHPSPADCKAPSPQTGPGRSRAPGAGRGPGRGCRSRDRGWPTRRAPGRSRRISLADHLRRPLPMPPARRATSRSRAAAARPSSSTSPAWATPAARSVDRVADEQAGAGVQHHDVAMRAPLAGQHPPGQAGVRLRVTAAQVLGRRAGPDRRRPGSTVVRRDLTVPQLQSVDVVVVVSSSRPSCTVDHQHLDRRHGPQHVEHPLGHRRVGDADHHPADPCRVGHRAEDVEGRRDAELPPGRPGVAQRRVEAGREAEADARPRSTQRGHAGRADSSRVTPRASSRSADAAAGRRGPVAVLAHRHAGAGHHEAARVDTLMVWLRSPPVPTTSTARSRRSSGERHQLGGGEHGVEQSGELVDRLALHAQRHHEGRRAGPGWRCPAASRPWPPGPCSVGRSRPATSGPSTAGQPPRSARSAS